MENQGSPWSESRTGKRKRSTCNVFAAERSFSPEGSSGSGMILGNRGGVLLLVSIGHWPRAPPGEGQSPRFYSSLGFMAGARAESISANSSFFLSSSWVSVLKRSPGQDPQHPHSWILPVACDHKRLSYADFYSLADAHQHPEHVTLISQGCRWMFPSLDLLVMPPSIVPAHTNLFPQVHPLVRGEADLMLYPHEAPLLHMSSHA